MRDYPLNCRVSEIAATRLKALAKSQRKSFGELLDDLILNVPIAQADWEQAILQLAIRVAALESGHIHVTEPEPEPVPEPAPGTKRGHTTLNADELAELKSAVQGFIRQSKYQPTLSDISAFLWEQHIGQTATSGEIVPLTRAGTKGVLKKMEINHAS
jgi:Zn-dependent M28 family amino/carboxypeptidase